MVDGAVLAVRPDKNRRRMVIRGAEAFSNVEVNLMGIVVNHLSGDSSGDYYGYGYGYGSPALSTNGMIYMMESGTHFSALPTGVPPATSPWPSFRGNPRNTGNANDVLRE